MSSAKEKSQHGALLKRGHVNAYRQTLNEPANEALARCNAEWRWKLELLSILEVASVLGRLFTGSFQHAVHFAFKGKGVFSLASRHTQWLGNAESDGRESYYLTFLRE